MPAALRASAARPSARAGHGFGLSFERAPADIAAVKALRPVDPRDGGIGLLARRGQTRAQADDVQDAPPIGQEPLALALRSGMKDQGRRQGGLRRIEPLDLAAAFGAI